MSGSKVVDSAPETGGTGRTGTKSGTKTGIGASVTRLEDLPLVTGAGALCRRRRRFPTNCICA